MVLLVIGGGVFFYTQQTQSTTDARENFNSAFVQYQRSTRTGEFNPAVNALKQVANNYSKTEVADKALFFLGKAYMKQGEYLEAMRQFQTIRDQYPKSFFHSASLLNLSYSASHRENYKQARTFIRKLLDREKEGPLREEAIWQKSMIQLKMDQRKEAIQSLSQLINNPSDEGSFWMERAKHLKALLQS